MGDLHDAGVVTPVRCLARHVAPPAEHGVKRPDHACAKDIWRGREHVMHPRDGTDRGHEQRYRPDRRPGAWLDKVVIVMRLGMGVGHLKVLRALLLEARRAISSFSSPRPRSWRCSPDAAGA